MKLRWNEELKKVFLCLCIFVALSLVLLNLGLGIFRNQMRRDYTTLAAGVLENVLRLYPQVSEEELLQLLDQPETTGEGEALLARYGIFTEYGSRTLEGKEKRLHFFVLGMNLFLAGILALGAGGILIYLRRRQQRIRELQHYMERLSRGDYCLELEENGDDELSGLRNEIYRLTVLLKESAALEQRRRRALADSVADISHQLKTPLTSMTILMDNLLADQEMDKITRHHFLSEVSRQLTGMSWLIATMLKLSRLEAGVVELGREPVEAARLVDECAARLQTAAEWRDVSLEMRLQPGASLTADEKWTLEALCNIVKNAIEHSPGGSRVQIETAENEIYTEIRVTDSGTGISRE